jgi:hypothetical protein
MSDLPTSDLPTSDRPASDGPVSDEHSPTVHWVGTGLSTGRGLHRIAQVAPVTVWGRTAEKAAECARRVGIAGSAAAAAFSVEALAAAVAPGDVVVSMLPATDHPALLRVAIDGRAHFASSSYTSAEVATLAAEAEQAGLVVLTEAGLDPGLDHLLAHVLVAEACAEIGNGPATASLTSYCGGVPAVANDFRYRFSWAPAGVLTALLNPARYVEDGEVTTAERPWEAAHVHEVDGEPFEVYPNRDSIGFVSQYHMPRQWQIESFVRGTLRLPGWLAAWSDVFAALAEHGTAVVDELAADLAARHPTTPADRDRVVLEVCLDVVTHDRRRWSGARVLDMVGDHDESAMAALVSGTLAAGVARILDSTLPAGLNRAAESAAAARPWIAELEAAGIQIRGEIRGAAPALDGVAV